MRWRCGFVVDVIGFDEGVVVGVNVDFGVILDSENYFQRFIFDVFI